MAKKLRKKKAVTSGDDSWKYYKNRGFGASNYNKVRKVLWQKHKSDFGSYKEFISSGKSATGQKVKGSSIPSQIFNQIKVGKNKKFTIKEINRTYVIHKAYLQKIGLDIGKETKIEELVAPIIPSDLRHAEAYFYMPTDLSPKSFPSNLFLRSPLLTDTVEGFFPSSYNYYNTFERWVRWCDQERDSGRGDGTSFAFYFIFTPPKYNDEEQRWESTIMQCDSDGNYFDENGDDINFGYDPNTFSGEATYKNVPVKKQKEEIQQDYELEKVKEQEQTKRYEIQKKSEQEAYFKELNDLKEMMKDKSITFKEYQEEKNNLRKTYKIIE